MTNLNRNNVTKVSFLGETSFQTGLDFNGTEVGGLSGIAYDASKNAYYALSDDRSSNARFYTLGINLSDGKLDSGDITFNDVTTLQNADGNPFADGSLDPEGIALTNDGNLFISSEGDANQLINPFVNQFSLQGKQLDELPIPQKFNPTENQTSGIRNNAAFESLTITPNQRYLYTATENALFQDGAAADVDRESLSRIIKYDLTTAQPVGEFVYEVGEVTEAPDSETDFRTNGLVELLATDNDGTLLALERSFTFGKGNTVKLYEVQTQGALDVSGEDDLFDESQNQAFEIDPAVEKRLLVDFADLGIAPDNLEGLALGPQLDDGTQSLIVVSDNNFLPIQTTQFIALGLDFESTPAVLPKLETPGFINVENAENAIPGDADDAAIWINPDNSGESIVIGTLKDGGLATFNLQGEIQQTISPTTFGEQRYNNVDIIYNFSLASMMVGAESIDLAVVSDRANDSLAIFSISENGQLEKLSTPQLDNPDFSIFGEDDGEATAYGLATYTNPDDGKSYVFVTQADGNKVAQLELTSKLGTTDEQLIEAEVVRTIELPIPEDAEAEDGQAEGLVVDQELGFLYVAMEEGSGILKLSAAPEGGSDFTVVQSSQEKTDFQKTPFTDFITFGDSLADVGNVFLATQGSQPLSPPYDDGRFSNGKLVPELIAEELGFSASTPSLAGGNNYAFGGAEAGSGFADGTIPNVGEQIKLYLATNTPAATDVFFISAGSNDLLPDTDAGTTDQNIPTPENVLEGLTENITTLADAGAENFIIPNLISLGTVLPLAQNTVISNALNTASSQFNTLFDTELDELEDELGINIIELDVAQEVAQIQSNPNDFGLTNVNAPALNTETGAVVPNPDEYFWWDGIHPTAAAYSLVAQGLADKIPEIQFADTNTSPLVPDIEGLSIYYGDEGNGYLIASSQGDSSYAVFEREGTNEYLGSFIIGENGDIDGVNETDGLDVINVGLGSEFPNGLLVVQDGANDPQFVVQDEEELENASTNFKFIDWEQVASSFENPLTIDTESYNPRDTQLITSQNINPINISNKDAEGNDIELIDLRAYANQTVTATVTIEREAKYDNNVYLYEIDNVDGGIIVGNETISTTAENYLQAALNAVVTSTEMSAPEDTEDEPISKTISIQGGNLFGIAIVADGTLAEAQNNLDSVEGVYFS
ncbi:MAG: phytase, partial [Cyanobacteria bacterium P01_C01_bin.38]